MHTKVLTRSLLLLLSIILFIGCTTNNMKSNTSIDIYLPKGSSWFDFWTGKQQDGGQNVEKECPLDILPLYVKTGSILPLGPFLQYAEEKPADTREIRIYPGADASFALYEDENDNYNYEKGVFATIQFK